MTRFQLPCDLLFSCTGVWIWTLEETKKMPAMSQCNFDEQTRGELPRTRTLFAQRDR